MPFDFDLLRALADVTLAPGQSALFEWNISVDNSNWSTIDNVAISGILIPEPSWLALLAAGLLALLGVRRRVRK